jgi:hypothetical protein
MKPNLSTVILGFALILAGAFALANSLGYLKAFSITTWMFIFTSLSAIFFIAFLVDGLRAWGWLFPVSIFAALAGSMRIVGSNIPTEWIPALIVGSVALPFIFAFLIDRNRTWALIPAFILGFVAFIPLFGRFLPGSLIASLIVAAIGLPFITVYLVAPRFWWGIIPGGIMFSIALMLALNGALYSTISVAIMFLGWALTFGLVWLRSNLREAAWAKYPALAMGILACIMFFITSGLESYWSVGLIIGGLALVIYSLRPSYATI